MREAGVNLVSVGIFSWALLEPREGEYDFSFLDEVLDLLAGAGIDVDLGTPTTVPPAWFWAGVPAGPSGHPRGRDARVRLAGDRLAEQPRVPAGRAAIAAKLAERYAHHPAVVMWHVHNEYGAPVAESFDAASVANFRAWLERRYGSLDALNTAWGTTFWGQVYGTWDEVDAPRQVEAVLQAIATGQMPTSGAAVAPTAIQSAPFVVRVRLDDTDFANRLPAGATGTAAIFTEHVKAAHVIRKVVLRQIAILNYVYPF